MDGLSFIRKNRSRQKAKYDRLWWKKFSKLKVIAAQRDGDPNVPPRDALGRWLSTQRRAKMLGKLSAEKVGALEKLGVMWLVYFTWLDMFSELKEAAASRRGNPNVPYRYGMVGRWLYDQRVARNAGKLRPGRVKMLEELGVTWVVKNRKKRTPENGQMAGPEL